MTYAIISDIHGNLPAFEAVLADAKAQGADMYLLLGDYTNGFPWGAGVMELIRRLENAVVVRGNGEDYLIDIKKNEQTDFSGQQFKPVYWAYNSLTAESLDYIAKLPEELVIRDGGTDIYLRHAVDLFFKQPMLPLFSSRAFREIMTREPFPLEQYNQRAQAALLADSRSVADMRLLPKGIHLFGHNHLQFHVMFDGNIFINPGSCGEPLDWQPTAAYTLLDSSEKGWAIIPRRVEYDLPVTALALMKSAFAAESPVWAEVMRLELLYAKDYFMSFVMHLVATGKKLGRAEFPVSNETWEIAVKTWDAERI